MSKPLNVLISGASFAGLSTAYWLIKMGHKVTLIEIAEALRRGGTAVDIKEGTVDIVKRMGIYEQIKANRLALRMFEFKNAQDVTENQMVIRNAGDAPPDDSFEVERDVLLGILFDAVKQDVEILFKAGVAALRDTGHAVEVTLTTGAQRSFDLVFGCDGIHSAVRKLHFGPEAEYMHFLEQYFSVTIVDKLLIERDTAQMFNVPGKTIMLNAYKDKTDIIFGFVAEKEIAYDRRNAQEQRDIIQKQFAGESWRATELLAEVAKSTSFYFDKLCQIRMPAWSKGRVALVGDAAYCPSPAAGMGGSLAIVGAAALADAMQQHGTDYAAAFADYDKALRPYIENVQAEAVRTGVEMLVPRTEEAIRERNTGGKTF